MTKHDFADGKYTVISDSGKLTALRNGEPWGRDLVGDNLVYWMLIEVDRLKAHRDELLEALEAGPSILHWLPSGDCNCSQCNFVRMKRAAISKATGQ